MAPADRVAGATAGMCATSEELTTRLLTTDGCSLWAELEGRLTEPAEHRKRFCNPWAVKDSHAERLLLGCLLVYGRYALAGAAMAGLRPQSFSRADLRALYERLLAVPAGREWSLALLAETREQYLMLMGLVTHYLDTVSAVESEMAATWEREHELPWLGYVDAREAAYGLAERVVRLAMVRAKLIEANDLMAGRGVLAIGLGGVGI